MDNVFKFCYKNLIVQNEYIKNNSQDKNFVKCYYDIVKCVGVSTQEIDRAIKELYNLRIINFEKPPFKRVTDIESAHEMYKRIRNGETFIVSDSILSLSSVVMFYNFIYEIPLVVLRRDDAVYNILKYAQNIYKERYV